MDELIEIVFSTHHEIHNAETAPTALGALPATSMRLDLHGVLDTVTATTVLPTQFSYCVISFVGKKGPTRSIARNQIQERIQCGQILFGVLVFAKAYKAKEKRAFFAPGGKAWVLQHLPSSVNCPYFVDDTLEHLQSAQALLTPFISCFHFQQGSLIHLLENIGLN